jgi:L,D-transpeptidase YnhG
VAFFVGLCLLANPAHGASKKKHRSDPATSSHPSVQGLGSADAGLIEVYKLIGAGQIRQALDAASQLSARFPHFQLAHLVHADLLNAMHRPLGKVGDVDGPLSEQARNALQDLREESRLRLQAIREKPPAGHIPAAFLQLSDRNKHAIAVDASRARLYLFENRNGQMVLIADYYISLGKLGIEKHAEGDLRTPLGVYYITGTLSKKSLKSFYGAGALPINYPNPYDTLRGKTGSGIWLHGTPPEQYSRAPKASDGCVVLSDPDLSLILQTVEPRTTPVVIAPQLQWIESGSRASDRQTFLSVINAWKRARTSGEWDSVKPFYTSDFRNYDKNFQQWSAEQLPELKALNGQSIDLKNISALNWRESTGVETMVVTFDELVQGARRGVTKRQYWIKLQGGWKIFFEAVIS